MKLCAKFATCYKKIYGECRTKKGVNYTDIHSTFHSLL